EMLRSIYALCIEIERLDDEEGRIFIGDVIENRVPARQWIVRDWLGLGFVTMFGGRGGLGKSNIALELAICVANNWPWYGHALGGSGVVIAHFAEDDELEVQRRTNRMMRDLIAARMTEEERD